MMSGSPNSWWTFEKVKIGILPWSNLQVTSTFIWWIYLKHSKSTYISSGNALLVISALSIHRIPLRKEPNHKDPWQQSVYQTKPHKLHQKRSSMVKLHMFSSRMNGYLKFFLIVVRRLQNTVELSVLQLDIDPPYTNNKFHHIPINHREIWLGGYQASEE